MTEERLRGLFLEVQKGTNNFTDFSPKVLMESSNRLIIFRLALGLSLKQFAKLFDLHFDTISQHERIKEKTMKLESAEKFMKVIKNKFESKDLASGVNMKKVLFNFNNFRNMLKGGFVCPENLLAFNSLPLRVRKKSIIRGVINSFVKRKLTPLEEKVFNCLKMKNINVTSHFMIGTKEIDLAVWNNDKPSLLIEVIQESFDPLKIIKLRKKIELPIICLAGREKKRDVIAFAKTFDAVFFEDELNHLVEFVKNNKNDRIFSIEPIEFRELNKRNDAENEVWKKLSKISDELKSQLKFVFKVNDKICSKTIDFALPGIFIEVKSGEDLEFQINRAAIESLFFKTLFPDLKFFVLFNSSTDSMLRSKINSLPLKAVGIDKVFFSDNDIINEIKSARGETRIRGHPSLTTSSCLQKLTASCSTYYP